MSEPLVTVYIPTYNRLELLKRALESVYQQTYQNIQIIVVDDGSTDGTVTYMQRLSKQDKNVVFLQNASNQGACVSRNKAIAKADGEFVIGLDDDDFYTKTRIESFVLAWPARPPNVVAFYSERIKQLKDRVSHKLSAPANVSYEDIFLANYVGNQFFCKKDTVLSVGGFDPALPAWQDLDFALKILCVGNAQKVGEASYVVDASHPHERISGKKIEKIQQAYQLIVKKHHLTDKQKYRLQAQLLIYQFTFARASSLFVSMLIEGDARASLLLSKQMLRNLFLRR